MSWCGPPDRADRDETSLNWFRFALGGESRLRSLSKAACYRVTATLVTYGIAAVLISPSAAGALALAEAAGKIALYYTHERLWGLVRWGKRA